MNNKVLACIDHSSYTPSICDYAAWAATRLAAPLEFIHVLDRHPEKAPVRDFSGSIGLGTQEHLLEDLALLDEKRSRLAQEAGRQLIEAAKLRAASAGVAHAEGRQRHGELVETLAEMENDARLFVLGKRGEAAETARQHLGSNLERVVRALHRPILAVPADFRAPRNIMVAFDGSATTRKGVEMIASSPLFRGLPCHVVMADSGSASAKEQIEWARTTLERAGFETHTAIVAGDAEAALAAYLQAHDIDLLAMGAYGHSRIRQLLVGSTTTTMLRTLSVPILLLR
ncbi:MAG: universal stress protein UspA [Burkholderiales bacterium RIFCSPLOWO2_02_FULL_57_36]|nr:MAG: universal stress protein UspA [Burkholderiales bacterium RIFCSPLOWO2_02_FULL_57_36]